MAGREMSQLKEPAAAGGVEAAPEHLDTCGVITTQRAKDHHSAITQRRLRPRAAAGGHGLLTGGDSRSGAAFPDRPGLPLLGGGPGARSSLPAWAPRVAGTPLQGRRRGTRAGTRAPREPAPASLARHGAACRRDNAAFTGGPEVTSCRSQAWQQAPCGMPRPDRIGSVLATRCARVRPVIGPRMFNSRRRASASYRPSPPGRCAWHRDQDKISARPLCTASAPSAPLTAQALAPAAVPRFSTHTTRHRVPDGSGQDALGTACDRDVRRASVHRFDVALNASVWSGVVREAELLDGADPRGRNVTSVSPLQLIGKRMGA